MKRTTITALSLTLAAGAVLAAAGPALAHSSDVTGVASCLDDGTVQVLWTVQTANVPAGEEGEVKVISPVNEWLFEWAEHKANHGLEALAPNASLEWLQTGIPGDATTATATFQIDWHGHSSDPVGVTPLPGDCTPFEEPTPTPTPEPTTPTVPPVCAVGEELQPAGDAYVCGPADEAEPTPEPTPTATTPPATAEPTPTATALITPTAQSGQLAETGPREMRALMFFGGSAVALGIIALVTAFLVEKPTPRYRRIPTK